MSWTLSVPVKQVHGEQMLWVIVTEILNMQVGKIFLKCFPLEAIYIQENVLIGALVTYKMRQEGLCWETIHLHNNL